MLGRIALQVLVFLVPVVCLAQEPGSVRVVPVPAWVERATFDADPQAYDAFDDGTLHWVLFDRQVNATVEPRHWYTRTVRLLYSQDAVATESQVEISFNPNYQRVELHSVGYHRGGHFVDQADVVERHVVQREERLDYRIFDGRQTVILILEGTQPGDFLDVEYSLIGQNPAYRGKFLAGHTLQTTFPIGRSRLRLLWPKGRSLQYGVYNRDMEPRERDLGSVIEYVWQVQDEPELDPVTNSPAWYETSHWLQLSEFQSWAEVASWGSAHYEPRMQVTGPVRRKLDDIRVKHETLEDRALAAVRFVQDDVRYMAVVLGEGTHVPNTCETVMKRRFGDCKDKAALLSAMLRDLGMQAHPALVNTERAYGVKGLLPSPGDFDHVIVRAVDEDDTLWIDPTISRQGGTLRNLYVPQYGLALPLKHGTRELEPVRGPPAKEATVEIQRGFTVRGAKDSVQLGVHSIYRGSSADEMRRFLEGTSLPVLAESYIDYYEGIFGSARPIEVLSVHDDLDANVLTVDELYVIGNFWNSGTSPGWADLYPYEIDSYMPLVPEEGRTAPLAIAYPRHLVHSTVVRLPEPWPPDDRSKSYTNPGFQFGFTTHTGNNQSNIRFEYRALNDYVSAEALADYSEDVNAMYEEFSETLYWADAAEGPGAAGSNWPMGILTLLSVALASWAAVRVYRKPPRIGPPLEPAPPGSPSGLGGWMILPMLGVVISPAVALYSIFEYLLPAVTGSAWQAVTAPGSLHHPAVAPWLTLMVMVAAVTFVWSVLNVVLMFNRRYSFPMMYGLFMIWAVGWGFIGTLALAWIANTADPEYLDIPSSIRDAMSGLLWTLYLYRSKRSRATFVVPAPSDPAPAPAPELPPEEGPAPVPAPVAMAGGIAASPAAEVDSEEEPSDEGDLLAGLDQDDLPTIPQRYLATVIDGFLGLAAFVTVVYALPGGSVFEMGAKMSVVVFLLFVYEPLCTSRLHTIGQHVMRVRVRRVGGFGRISVPHAYGRIVVKVLLGWISFLSIGFTRGRRGIHDLAVGSVVLTADAAERLAPSRND